jgi:hypothetical protein
MRKRGLNGTLDGYGRVERKRSLWHAKFELVSREKAYNVLE